MKVLLRMKTLDCAFYFIFLNTACMCCVYSLIYKFIYSSLYKTSVNKQSSYLLIQKH